MLFIKEKSTDQVRYPFFIQWGQPDDIREMEMKKLWQHKNSEPAISYISFAVENVQGAVKQYCGLFDLNQSACRDGHDEIGDFTEISISNLSIRFYQTTLETSPQIGSNRPFCCGISGVSEEKGATIKFQEARYKF